MNELNGGLGVDRGLSVGNASNAREPSGDRRTRARFDRLILFAARFAQVHVHVDEAWCHNESGGIDHLVGSGLGGADRNHKPIAYEHVVNAVDALRWIDNASAAKKKRLMHQATLPAEDGRLDTSTPPVRPRGPHVSHSTPMRTARPLVT